MAVEVSKNYVLEEFQLIPEKRLLSREGKQVRLASRPFQVLLYLIENRERIVTRDELLEKFWDGREVYDQALTKCVGAIRKALNDNQEKPRFIETRWAEGYRFIGQIKEELTPFEASFVEIEKFRETKLVIEETDENESQAPEKIIPVQTPKQLSSQKQFSWKTAAIAACLILAVVLGGFFLLRLNTTNNQNASSAQFNSVAVLPLKNLSNKPENEIFIDGLTESLISSLSKIEGLKVIARNSVFAFKNKDEDVRKIGQKLGVETVLEGSVRENGDKLRVEVRLVNTADGQVLWSSENYDRALGDIFEIQDDIARTVTTRLRLKLTSADARRLAKRQTNSVEAYQAYVKGRYFWKKKDSEALEKARRFFEEAIKHDPNYALAYTGLADYYYIGIWYAGFPPKEAYKAAKRAALKAVELDPELPQSYASLSHIAVADWNWMSNRKYLERAIELDPNDAHSWQGYAFALLNIAGQKEEALAAIKRAQELDPLSRSVNTDVGVMLTHLGRYDEAIAAFKNTLETDPDFNDAYWNLGRALERKGDYREAVAVFIENERRAGASEERLAALRPSFERTGINGFWQKKIDFMKEDAKTSPPLHCWFAAVYARLGEKELAFEHLEKAYAAREPLLVNLKSEYLFDSLRSDARFKDLVSRVGLDK